MGRAARRRDGQAGRQGAGRAGSAPAGRVGRASSAQAGWAGVVGRQTGRGQAGGQGAGRAGSAGGLCGSVGAAVGRREACSETGRGAVTGVGPSGLVVLLGVCCSAPKSWLLLNGGTGARRRSAVTRVGCSRVGAGAAGLSSASPHRHTGSRYPSGRGKVSTKLYPSASFEDYFFPYS